MNKKPLIGRDTRVCMSISARPGNFGSRFHNHLYELCGLDFIYKSFSTNDLPAAIGGIRALSIRGCAISMPFKEAVIPLIDELDASAAAIDCVNTIVNNNGHLIGYNTDYGAVSLLIADIDPAMDFVIRGSGGMARAVAAAFRDAGFKHGTIVARNETTGTELADLYGYKWMPTPTLSAQILVNVTPIGMDGGDTATLPFDEDTIRQADITFDVVQYPAETAFLSCARLEGKRVITGAEVAVLQALEQFALYTGIRPSQEQVAEAAMIARQ